AAADEPRRRPRWGIGACLAASTVLAGLIIFPLLYGLSLVQRPFPGWPTTTTAARAAPHDGDRVRQEGPGASSAATCANFAARAPPSVRVSSGASARQRRHFAPFFRGHHSKYGSQDHFRFVQPGNRRPPTDRIVAVDDESAVLSLI